MQNFTQSQKELIVRFLYQIAKSDNKVLPAELAVLEEASLFLQVHPDDLLSTVWETTDALEFNRMLNEDSQLLGFVTKWATDIMNADHIKHQNEQMLIFDLISASLDYPKYPKASLISIDELDEVQREMMKVTPSICMQKASHWQKSKKDKPLKRVAASLSFQKGDKIDFVTAVNYELSTPGGSRCAEQNAIGMMIAQNPEIGKEAVKDIFIYGGGGLKNPCWPCGICTENLSKINVDNQIMLYVYPENYVYEEGRYPKNMLRVSFVNFTNR